MGKMDDAAALVALAGDAARPAAERLAALRRANDLRRELKVGWAKLGSPGLNMADALATLEDMAKDEAAAKIAAAAAAASQAAAEPEQRAQGDAEKPLADESDLGRAEGEGMLDRRPEPEPEAPKIDRGGIGRLVNLLLTTTDADYASIVAEVRLRFPHARTTARSVASVAADLRRAGAEVATRRRPRAV